MAVPKFTYQRMADSRKMCFEQGKVYVALDPEDENIIVAEWPNGVILRECQKTGKIVRTWPDGYVEHFELGDPRHFEVPILPRTV